MQPLARYHGGMAQLSLRIDDDLHVRARQAAADAGTSLNAYISRVLSVAVDPAADEPENARIRARLAAAGLIPSADAPKSRWRNPEDEAKFNAALARSGGGTSASSLIEQERRSGW